MGISTSRLCDRRAYRGRIDGEYRMRAPSVASRSRTRGWRTATGPMPVMISRSGRWPWRTTRCWPVSVLRSVCFARNSATSASTAWVSSARAPLRRISVRESVKAPGWASLMTLLSDTAYHSFIGEVEALNTTTIPRLTRSRRHQLLAIARWPQPDLSLDKGYHPHYQPLSNSSYRSNESPLDTREDGPISSGRIGVDARIFPTNQRQHDVLIKEKANVRDQQRHRRRLLQNCDRRPGRRCLPALRCPHLSPAQSADRRRHGRLEEGR